MTMSRPYYATNTPTDAAHSPSGEAPSGDLPTSQVQAGPRTESFHRRRWAIVHPLQIRMLTIVLAYSLTILVMLAIPLFSPLMQGLDDRTIPWQEKALIANNLLDLHDRYWPWALGAVLVLLIHCAHSMLAMHHVAGPLYRLKTLFPQIGQGNLSIRTTLRKGDFLTPEADLVNQMTAQLQAKITSIKTAQAAVALDIGQLHQAVTAMDNPGLTALVKKTERDLAEMQSSLDAFRTDRGFTLIELMLAVAIVGVLSSLAIPNYLGFLEKARIARTVAEMNGIAKEIFGYAHPDGQYPDNLAQIGWDQRLDPWGNPYQYYRLNCANPAFSRLDPIAPSGDGSDELVLPAKTQPFQPEAHVSLAVAMGNLDGLIRLVVGGGGPGGGGGGPGGGGGGPGGGGPPCGSIGHARKDRFLVPINSDFDLYSMGKDGQSVGPLTAQKSHDDIIRANDGGYYGLASNF